MVKYDTLLLKIMNYEMVCVLTHKLVKFKKTLLKPHRQSHGAADMVCDMINAHEFFFLIGIGKEVSYF